MTTLHCDGRAVDVHEGETVLDALLRAGVRVAHSCRAGACQSCLVRAVRSEPPPAAQAGLSRERAASGYFLACQARPSSDLSMTIADVEGAAAPALIESTQRLAADVVRVMLAPAAGTFSCRAGQFLTLTRPSDGLARPYSVASVARGGASLEIHVRILPGGRMSEWLARPDVVGQKVTLRGPSGDCFYLPGDPSQPMLLAGVGTGLAPLLGVLVDALQHEHQAPITLVHGARTPDGLYLVDELRALSRRHSHVAYVACALEARAGSETGVHVAPIGRVVSDRVKSLAGHRVFLCGDPDLVVALRKQVFLAGARLNDIHADAFITAPPPAAQTVGVTGRA